MKDLQIFNYEETPVRVVDKDGAPWWVLADVCRVLELSNPSKVAARLDDDEKNTVHLTDGILDNPNLELGYSRRGNPNMTIINESGLYKVILRSDKPEAKKFTRWVTHEVLPAIRKTGAYSAPGVYPPKATSVGEVVNLIRVTRETMQEQGCKPADIAKAVKEICDQFGVTLPNCFIKPKETTLQDVYDMIDYIYSHTGRGQTRTYDDFLVWQGMKRLTSG